MQMNSMATRIAILGGLGSSPFAPGTVATLLAGIPGAILLGSVPVLPALLLLAAITLLGCIVSGRAEEEIGKHDSSEIVIDELAGYLTAVIAMPTNAKSLFVCFIFFRLFDIWKPWPISLAQARVKGGLGIVLDDILAGIAANAVSRFILHLWP